MPLINCKIDLLLTWNQNCILSTFTITDAKLYIPVVTLLIENNTKLLKLLSEGFKRSVYRNEYKVTPNKNYNANEYIRERLNASIQGVKRLFVLAYGRKNNDAIEISHKKYFLPRERIEIYNIENDRGNFYDQPINDSIK